MSTAASLIPVEALRLEREASAMRSAECGARTVDTDDSSAVAIPHSEGRALRTPELPLAIYVHIPFCVRKCFYCDFNAGPATRRTREGYVKALCREITDSPWSLRDGARCPVLGARLPAGGDVRCLVPGARLPAEVDYQPGTGDR